MRNIRIISLAIIYLLSLTGFSKQENRMSISVPIYLMKDKGESEKIGTVKIEESPGGLVFTPMLKGLRAGEHGFHVHNNPSCANHGMAAGPHFDPQKTNTHLGPYKNGHLGDLPRLNIEASGNIKPVVAPRLMKISQILNHSLMIHEGGDNYTDHPENGGGGGRMACGVIK
jgi:Cu-Zn family superoxide dismutase